MTILQGTMQDGTVIPVQVDNQGRLVAEGIPGKDGIQLPPNPVAGQLLGWDGAALAWFNGGEVVPSIPETDEITAVSGSSAAPILTLKTDKGLSLFAVGDSVTQDNSAYVDVSRQFSHGIQTPPSGFDGTFNGNPFAPGTPTYGTHLKLTAVANEAFVVTFDPPLTGITSLVIQGGTYAASKVFTLEISDGSQTTSGSYATGVGYASPDLDSIIPASGTISSIRMISSVENCGIMSITANGNRLVDGETITSLAPAGVVSSIDIAAKAMTLRDSIGTWGPANAGHTVIGPNHPTLRLNPNL